MPVTPIGSTSTAYEKKEEPVSSANASMSMSDFYKVLATQLKYQDADNPMDTSEMMAQMVQTQMIQAITQMSTISTTTYSASMLGKQVTVAEIDQATGMATGKYTTGEVTGVILGDNPILYIGDKPYSLSQVMSVGDVPMEDPDKTDPEDPDKTDPTNPDESKPTDPDKTDPDKGDGDNTDTGESDKA